MLARRYLRGLTRHQRVSGKREISETETWEAKHTKEAILQSNVIRALEVAEKAALERAYETLLK